MKHKTHIITVIIVSMALATSCKNNEEATPASNNIPIRVEQVAEQKMIFPVRAIGKVSLSTEQKLAFKIGGIVHDINVSEGQQVKAGQVLASLNLAEIEANVSQAKQGFEKAQRDFVRVENLYHDSVATLEQYQDIQTAMEVAKAKLDIAQFNLRFAQIKAPSNGVVLKQLAEANELIGAGYPVFLFGSVAGNKFLKVNVADQDIIKLTPGDSAHVFFDAYPGEVFKADITGTGEFPDPYTGTYEVEVTLLHARHKIPSGFVGRVALFPAGQQKVLTIPMKALFNASEMVGYVWVVKNGNLEKRKLKIEKILENAVVVKNTISPRDTIVTEGYEKLNKNAEFTIVD